jgi:hypothetical protein
MQTRRIHHEVLALFRATRVDPTRYAFIERQTFGEVAPRRGVEGYRTKSGVPTETASPRVDGAADRS